MQSGCICSSVTGLSHLARAHFTKHEPRFIHSVTYNRISFIHSFSLSLFPFLSKYGTLHKLVCHSCSRAMLIFSVLLSLGLSILVTVLGSPSCLSLLYGHRLRSRAMFGQHFILPGTYHTAFSLGKHLIDACRTTFSPGLFKKHLRQRTFLCVNI